MHPTIEAQQTFQAFQNQASTVTTTEDNTPSTTPEQQDEMRQKGTCYTIGSPC